MKMKKSKIEKEMDYWEFDNPEHRKFIDEVRANGTVVGVDDYTDRTSVFRTYEYKGKRYINAENPAYPDGIGDMFSEPPQPDYSVLTFDLFKKTIQDYIDDYDRHMKEFYDSETSIPYEPLGDYTFHDNGDGHYTFSFDGTLYELMNYGTGDFKWGLHDALENAGFEWGVNVDMDTYSDIGFYDHSQMKSTKKSYTPDYHDFRTMLTNMKITKDNRTVFKR